VGERRTFLGIPIITQEDIDREVESQEPGVYTVIRCADSAPGSGSAALRARRIRTLCEGCREVCWLDPKSYDPLAGMNLTILCMQCVAVKIQKQRDDLDG